MGNFTAALVIASLTVFAGILLVADLVWFLVCVPHLMVGTMQDTTVAAIGSVLFVFVTAMCIKVVEDAVERLYRLLSGDAE